MYLARNIAQRETGVAQRFESAGNGAVNFLAPNAEL